MNCEKIEKFGFLILHFNSRLVYVEGNDKTEKKRAIIKISRTLTLWIWRWKWRNSVGWTQRRVQNAEHPNDQPNNAGFIEGNFVLVTADDSCESWVAVVIGIVGNSRPCQI